MNSRFNLNLDVFLKNKTIKAGGDHLIFKVHKFLPLFNHHRVLGHQILLDHQYPYFHEIQHGPIPRSPFGDNKWCMSIKGLVNFICMYILKVQGVCQVRTISTQPVLRASKFLLISNWKGEPLLCVVSELFELWKYESHFQWVEHFCLWCLEEFLDLKVAL